MGLFDAKRTPKAWAEYLGRETGEYTLEEYSAGCLSMILGHIMASREAVEHTEGMTGAIDQFLAAIAPRMGIDYAASSKIREAMDARRGEQRRLGADQRARALQEGQDAV